MGHSQHQQRLRKRSIAQENPWTQHTRSIVSLTHKLHRTTGSFQILHAALHTEVSILSPTPKPSNDYTTSEAVFSSNTAVGNTASDATEHAFTPWATWMVLPPVYPCSRWCLWQTRRHSLPRYTHTVDMIQAQSRRSTILRFRHTRQEESLIDPILPMN